MFHILIAIQLKTLYLKIKAKKKAAGFACGLRDFCFSSLN